MRIGLVFFRRRQYWRSRRVHVQVRSDVNVPLAVRKPIGDAHCSDDIQFHQLCSSGPE